MSWQDYVNVNLVGSGKIDKAAILGLQGGIWAASPGFAPTPEQQKAIVDGFNNPDNILANGIRLAEEKYFTISADKRTIQGKKLANGVVIVKTKQAVLIGVYIGPVQAPEVVPVVEGLADYLISLNY